MSCRGADSLKTRDDLSLLYFTLLYFALLSAACQTLVAAGILRTFQSSINVSVSGLALF